MNHIARLLLTCCLLISFSLPIQAQPTLALTVEEEEWLKAHPTLRLGVDPSWPPLDFVDEQGNHAGVAADFLDLISQRLEVNFELAEGLTWSKVLQGARDRRIDVVSLCAPTTDREEYLLFPRSIISVPWAVVTRKDFRQVNSFGELKGDDVVMVKGYAVVDLAKSQFSDVPFRLVETPADGITAVATGMADAYVDNLAVAGNLIQKQGLDNLKIACDAGFHAEDLYVSVRSDWPELASIMDKAVSSIGPEETAAIRRRWMPIQIETTVPEEQLADQPDGVLSWWLIPIAFLVMAGLAILSRIIDRPVTEEELAQLSGRRRFWLALTFANLKISAKILIILVLVAATSVGLFGYMDYREARRTLREESFSKLTAVREMKAQQIEDYFETITNQIVTFSESRTVIDAMARFKAAFADLEAEAGAVHSTEGPADPRLIQYYQEEFLPRLTASLSAGESPPTLTEAIPRESHARYLQEQYLAANPNPTGEKHRLDDAGDGSEYSSVHKTYHPIIRNYLERFGYYDIFLVDHKTGHIVYSVFKEVDYGSSLLTGPYRETNFATAFRAACDAAQASYVRLEDFKPYAPSINASASFIASPIFDGEEMLGVLVFQMPIDRINNIMTSLQSWKDVGLGNSGETYIVGDDLLMRNQSRFLLEDRENYLQMIRNIGLPEEDINRIDTLNTSIGLQMVDTKGTRSALKGQINTEVFPDYRGVPVLSSYRLLALPNVRWAIMSEIDEAEAMSPAERLKKRSLGLMALFLSAILAISFAFAKTMTRPLKVLTAKANALAHGDLGVSIEINGGDEIAQLGQSFDVMRKALADLIGGLEDKVAERTEEIQKQKEMLENTLESLTHPFYVIDANTYEILVMNSAAKKHSASGASTCHALTHRRDSPCDSSEHPCPLEIVQRTKAPAVVEHIHFDENGNEIYAEVHGYPVFDGEGQVIQMIEYSLDITERKLYEAKLRLQATALNSAANAIVITDPSGTIQWVNTAYTALTGYTSEETYGQNPRILNSGKQDPEFFENLWNTIQAGRTWRGEIINKRKNGALYTEEMTITPVRNNDGEIIQYIAIKQDITARKKAERALSHQYALTRSLVDTLPNPVFVKDPDTRYVLFNRAYEMAYGIKREDCLGKKITELEYISTEIATKLQTEDEEIIRTGGMLHREQQSQHADGTEHSNLYWVTRFELDDASVGGLVGIEVDITKQKALEQELEIANARMAGELNVGREIQMNMVPLTFPAFPERDEFTVFATLEPAREVGGDFYDFHFVSDDWLLFCVGDVSDKGVPAALFMAVTKTLIKSRATDDIAPERIITRINDELSADNKSCMFVTLFVAFLNVKTGKILYTNAGHNPPYIKRSNGTLEKLAKRHGPVVGAMPDIIYKSNETELSAGDLFVLFTDGVTEAKGIDTGLYGEERLEELLSSMGEIPVEAVVSETVNAVQTFQGWDHQADDITVLALRFEGAADDEVLQSLDITIKNQRPDISVVDREFTALAESFDLPKKISRQVRLSCDELLNNVISYAYNDDYPHQISVSISLYANRLTIIISDDGEPFNPFKQETPDTKASLEEREIGGLGIHLVKNMMSSVSYERKDSRNVVTLVKELNA